MLFNWKPNIHNSPVRLWGLLNRSAVHFYQVSGEQRFETIRKSVGVFGDVSDCQIQDFAPFFGFDGQNDGGLLFGFGHGETEQGEQRLFQTPLVRDDLRQFGQRVKLQGDIFLPRLFHGCFYQSHQNGGKIYAVQLQYGGTAFNQRQIRRLIQQKPRFGRVRRQNFTPQSVQKRFAQTVGAGGGLFETDEHFVFFRGGSGVFFFGGRIGIRHEHAAAGDAAEYLNGDERTEYRADRAEDLAPIFLAGNMTEKENVEKILSALSSFGVTEEKYVDFGYTYTGIRQLAVNATLTYRARYDYEMGILKDTYAAGGFESQEAYAKAIADKAAELQRDIASSLLASLPSGVSDALEEVGKADLYTLIVGSIFYKLAGLLLPIIYMIMASNNLIAGQVDSGSMAYVLSTSTKRKTVVFTQGVYLVGSLLAMFTLTTVTGCICLAIVSEDEMQQEVASGAEAIIVLDKTVMYAEMGGQVADHGKIVCGDCVFEVNNVQKNKGGKFMHYGVVKSGHFAVGDHVTASYCEERRRAIRRAHSATHLLQAALVQVLGDHVHQAGSLVEPDRLRFDFTHFSALTAEEIGKVTALMADMILDGADIETKVMPYDEAKKLGATALFGEKYGDTVRVVKMGDYSMEFCGGTHLDNTAKVGMFTIISEGSVASGVRRIEAITGKEVIERYAAMSGMLSRVADKLKTRPVEIMAKVENNLSEIHDLKQKLDKMKDQLMSGEAERMLYGAKDIKGLKVITITNGPVNAADIRKMGDQLKDRFPNIVAVLAATAEDKATMLAVCGKNAVARGIKAGDLIKNITKICGGSGGGKPDSAMGGCKEILKLDDAMAAVDDFVNANAKD